MKNILFLVTGMTPQIITETVWALACDPNKQDKWIPDEVHVLTTEHGFNLINTRLLDKGVFERFKMDYPTLKNIKFDKSYIAIIHHNGKNLTDLKTPDDNEMSADLICEKVRQFTQDDNVCLHVSIAGGRKTMGFYAGYALSLYGRSQDKMSHILVEENFENVPDFYYPTPDDFEIIHDKGHSLNAKNAKVWLADIPFVRLRSSLGANAMVHHQKFSDVVVDFDYLSQTLSYIKKKMIANFGVEIFNKIGIQDIGNGYGLNLSPNQIVIEEM